MSPGKYLMLSLGLALAGGSLQAQESTPDESATTQEQEAFAVDRRAAATLAGEAHDGRVLSVRLEEGVWTVRMESEGRVFEVLVDAREGQIIEEEDDESDAGAGE